MQFALLVELSHNFINNVIFSISYKIYQMQTACSATPPVPRPMTNDFAQIAMSRIKKESQLH